VPWPAKVRRVFPIAVGASVGLVTAGGASAAISLAHSTLAQPTLAPGREDSVSQGSPQHAAGRIAAGTVTAAGLLAAVFAGGWVARQRLLARLIASSAALDAALEASPRAALVSAGPNSLQQVAELGREGARFVNWATGPDDVKAVLTDANAERQREPIRVFVGAMAAPSVQQRVGIAMAELRRLGAFERSTLLVQAPAGTGYANSTPADVLEMLTAGDCASVAVGYGLLPSFLSLRAVPAAAQTQELLFAAIADERARLGSSTRVLAYGESLGAKVQQVALPGGLADLDRWGIDRALWVGTPGGRQSDDFRRQCGAEAVVLDSPADLPLERADCRVWFLQHDGDPVVRFRPDLLWARPDWLPRNGQRGRNVPAQLQFRPGLTYLQTLVDTLFATNVKPGDFQSIGHDYRADLGAVVTAAFQLPLPGSPAPDQATLARLDARLRALEVGRAARVEDTA
jgi:uncharacterized membrane protein